MKTATSLIVVVIVTTILDEGLDMMIAGQGVIKLCHQDVDVTGRRLIIRVR